MSDLQHDCELKQETFALGKLPPNATIFAKLYRKFRKVMTVDPESTKGKKFFRNKSSMLEEQRRHLNTGPFFIIHPFSKVNTIREIIFIIVWFFLLVWHPIAAGFTTIGDFNEVVYETDEHIEMYYFLVVVVYPLQIFMVICCFITGYIHKKQEVVLSFKKIVIKYCLTYFIFDLTTIVASYPYMGRQDLEHWQLAIIYMIVYARIGTTLLYIRHNLLLAKIRSEFAWCIILILISFFMLHVFTCMFYLIESLLYANSLWPDNSWPNIAKVDPDSDPTVFKAYSSIFLLITCHFFGAGHTSIHVKLPCEELMLVIVMIVGRTWTLCLIAYLLRVFSIVTISEDKYEEYLVELKEYMRQKNLPKDLSERLIEYYRYKYHLHYFNETAIFNTLSAYIRQELLLWSARKLIAKVELFKSFPRTVVGSIIGNCKSNIYLNGDVIAKAGDNIDNIYFISSGTLAVMSEDNFELAHLEDGNEVGLISALDLTYTVYHFTYVAVETSEIYYISKKDFRTYLEDNKDLLKYFKKNVTEKIKSFRRAEERLRSHDTDLLSELSGGKILEKPRKRTTFFDT